MTETSTVRPLYGLKFLTSSQEILTPVVCYVSDGLLDWIAWVGCSVDKVERGISLCLIITWVVLVEKVADH